MYEQSSSPVGYYPRPFVRARCHWPRVSFLLLAPFLFRFSRCAAVAYAGDGRRLRRWVCEDRPLFERRKARTQVRNVERTRTCHSGTLPHALSRAARQDSSLRNASALSIRQTQREISLEWAACRLCGACKVNARSCETGNIV